MDLNATYIKKSLGIRYPEHTSDYSENIMVKNLPLFGRLHFVRDKAGILSVLFVLFYWVYGTFTTLFIILLPMYNDERVSGYFLSFYISVSALCLFSLFTASTTNPGRVPLLSDSEEPGTEQYQICKVCRRKRPPRAHHCRRCQQCVLKMDHHCPWINNCVGEENHYAFYLLLLYAFLLGFLSFLCCMIHFWVYPKCKNCDLEVFYMKHRIWFLYLLTLMGFTMALFMSAQCIGQHFNILVDRTTLENIARGHIQPEEIKSRGWLKSYREVFGSGTMLLWWFPCRQRKKLQYPHFNTV